MNPPAIMQVCPWSPDRRAVPGHGVGPGDFPQHWRSTVNESLRGRHRPECPHCEARVTVNQICLRLSEEAEPFVEGWHWQCGHCLAQGPVRGSEAEAWDSLRTVDTVQLERFRAWREALRESRGGPCEAWLRGALEDLGLEACESCEGLFPFEEMRLSEDGVELCDPCIQALQADFLREAERRERAGLFLCRVCQNEAPLAEAMGEVDEYATGLCPDCREEEA